MVAQMLREAFQVRGVTLQRTLIKAVEHRVERIAPLPVLPCGINFCPGG